MKLLPFIAAVLVVIEIILMNQMAGKGSTMHTVDVEIDTLRSENAILEQKVASASSLSTVYTQATYMGFSQPAKSQYLTVVAQMPVAMSGIR